MDFFQSLDYTMLLKAFIVGGIICVIGQILIDKTKLTSARILVIFVTTGAILGGLRNLPTFSGFRRKWSNSSSYWIWKPLSKRCHPGSI